MPLCLNKCLSIQKTSHFVCFLAIILTFLFVTGCSSIEVPEEKKNYIGYWKGTDLRLEIKANGDVIYAKKIGDYVETVESPLQGFEGDSFTIGYGIVSQTVKVTQAPFKTEEGEWKMVVDGITLTKEEVK